MNGWSQPGAVWLGVAVLMTAGWWWQWRTANAGIVDVLWALAVGASAVYYGLVADGAALPRASVATLGGAWGARLAWHLWRRVRGEAEDGRYRHLRAHWRGDQRRFFLFFQLQALLAVLFSLPFLAVARNPAAEIGGWWVAGIAIWLVSVIGEAVADRQLARFRGVAANHGKTCRDGLWALSRHPNYFFEWTHWFAYVCLALGSPLQGLAWSGPLLMLVFLRWISGVPYTEAQALRTRGDDYRHYQRTTSMLIPWFPKKDKR